MLKGARGHHRLGRETSNVSSRQYVPAAPLARTHGSKASVQSVVVAQGLARDVLAENRVHLEGDPLSFLVSGWLKSVANVWFCAAHAPADCRRTKLSYTCVEVC